MKFVDTASQFESSIRVKKDAIDVDGKSPMEMMLLEAVQGTILLIVASGHDARAAVQALAELVAGKFGED